MANWFQKQKDAKQLRDAKIEQGSSVAGNVFAQRDEQGPRLENELASRVVQQGGVGGTIVESRRASAGPKTVAELIAEKKNEAEKVDREKKEASERAKADAAVITNFMSNQRNDSVTAQVKPGKPGEAHCAAVTDSKIAHLLDGLGNKKLLTEVESNPANRIENSSTKEIEAMARSRAAMFDNSVILTEVTPNKQETKKSTSQEIEELEMIGGLIAGRVNPASTGGAGGKTGEEN